MKTFFIAFIAVCMTACVYDPYGNGPKPGYNSGESGFGPETKPITPFTSSRSFPVTGFSGCKDEAVSCNCNYTSAFPGETVPTRICNSGYHQFVRCQGFCPGGGIPWATVCTCN